MCLVKTPKPVQQQTQGEAKKKLQVLRNRDLDGIDPMVRARSLGSGTFRIDRGSGTNPPLPGATPAPAGASPGRLPVTRVPTASGPKASPGLLKILPLLTNGHPAAKRIKQQATQ